jgi:hypothetical protein
VVYPAHFGEARLLMETVVARYVSFHLPRKAHRDSFWHHWTERHVQHPEVQPFLYFNCLFDAVKTMGHQTVSWSKV